MVRQLLVFRYPIGRLPDRRIPRGRTTLQAAATAKLVEQVPDILRT